MGVTGLWTVLQPSGRPTKLETLNRARLAVDASIWIYQFLKAVRDKEGNALRNSHVVGFFRRICKLLFFGIKPVFVFDGGAPALKRQTILGRKRRREGRRDDAARTAGKLLAIQMQKRAEVAEEKRKREVAVRGRPTVEDEEEIPEDTELVYVDEIGMSNQERQAQRKFVKKDAYHLPEIEGGLEGMGQPNDPRIMSIHELQEFAKSHNRGENIDVYDFSKIDFDGEFFRALPAVDRYNILNAARLRSRLRMGMSKEQLDEMFPDRMAFSKFQIERVRERNELTQRLMHLNGQTGDELFGVGRIAGDRNREYVLVKNDGAEGGWALGVVSRDKDEGERHKPIDIDALHEQQQRAINLDESEEEVDFEDVPVEGLNRLPTVSAAPEGISRPRPARAIPVPETESLFVEQDADGLSGEAETEEEQLQRAIQLSLEKNFHTSQLSEDEDLNFEDVTIPAFQQVKVVEKAQPLVSIGGKGVAHIVNNRANAAIAKRKSVELDSDDEEDLQTVMAAARKKQKTAANSLAVPTFPNVKSKFDGPLPFPKMDLGKSLFQRMAKPASKPLTLSGDHAVDEHEMAEEEREGGFEKDERDKAKPLPPWLAEAKDIREDLKTQQADLDRLNAEDYEVRQEQERRWREENAPIRLDDSDDDDDIQFVDVVPRKKITAAVDLTETPRKAYQMGSIAMDSHLDMPTPTGPVQEATVQQEAGVEKEQEEFVEWSESDREDYKPQKPFKKIDETPRVPSSPLEKDEHTLPVHAPSPSPTFQDVEMPHKPSSPKAVIVDARTDAAKKTTASKTTLDTEVNFRPTEEDAAFARQEEDDVSDGDFGEFSDPEDEELLAQLALEAEEHARFASTLNSKTAEENQRDYERELKQLRNQQKKDRRDADEVSHIMITECQALLRLFGLPYITAPMEAEAQCAELVELGLVDGIVTDDSDIFLFGGTRVYKNMFNSNKFVESYLMSNFEKELSLNRRKLIDFAHILGSDYTEGLPGIGPVQAMEIISEFPTEDGLQQFKDWWTDVQQNNRPKEADNNSPFRKKFRRAQGKKLFLPPGFPSPTVTEAYLKPEVDSTPDPFQWGVPDLENLRKFLMSTIGWSQERTDEVLVPVIKDMNRREAEGTQSNITRFFHGTTGSGAVGDAVQRATGSTRMNEAVKKLKARSSKEKENPLARTFADEAREWARKNEISQDKHEERQKRKGRGKSRAATEDVE